MLCLAGHPAGIIHNVERPEDEHYKALVTDLAERYMRRPGVVIVCTITCTADIDTQVRPDCRPQPLQPKARASCRAVMCRHGLKGILTAFTAASWC
jgi:hypothetical protein